LMRKALRDLARVLPAHGARLIHQAFDAVVVACPDGEEKRVGAVVKQTMESAAQLRVPLVVKIKSGPNLAAVT
jgi:DNA polymerase I-like protein with 3'-5' exonuclease and polymerase domains